MSRQHSTIGDWLRSCTDNPHLTAEDMAAIHALAHDRERVRGLLMDLLMAFACMPDAGLSEGDPRYQWWHDTAPIRQRAREELT